MAKEQHVNQKNDLILVGSNIKRLRLQKHIKQIDFVAKLQLMDVNVTTFSLCKIENNLQNPTASLISAAAKLLDCDYNELFRPLNDTDGSNEKAPQKNTTLNK